MCNVPRLPLAVCVLLILSTSALGQSWWDKSREFTEEEVPVEAPAPKPKARKLKVKKPEVVVEDSTSDNDEEEVVEEAPKPKARKRAKRSIASEEPTGSVAVSKRKRSSKESMLFVNALVGFSQVSAGTSNAADAGNMLHGALGVDFRISNFGIELDGFYSTGGDIHGTDSVVGDTTTSVNQMGGMLNVKGQLPITIEKMKFTPKIGVGYGLISQSTSLATSIATVNTKVSTSGVFAVAGFDFKPMKALTIQADYAMSLMASGSIAVDGQGSYNPSGQSFSRLRVGALVQVADHINVGGQFLQRTLVAGEGESAETQNQVLGMFGLEF